jgi:hypothetical protein
MKRLLGIHITPPERAVVPPTSPVFSMIRTLLPSERMNRPAHIEPPPLPTTTKSKVSSKPATRVSCITVAAWRNAAGACSEAPAVGRQNEYSARTPKVRGGE